VTLIDTSVWIEHFRRPDAWLQRLLAVGAALVHPFVIGELALGGLPERDTTLRWLHRLPQPRVARPAEVLAFVEQQGLAGAGIGYVDAHLLAAASLTPPARLWSGDRRLAEAAGRLGLGVQPDA
jgi:predicted nucleic acid-binding protein